MNPLLRRATIADADTIANVYLRSRKELVSFAPLIHTDEDIFQWIRNDLLPEEETMVAEDKGIIIGYDVINKGRGNRTNQTALYSSQCSRTWGWNIDD